jgi:transposase
VQLPVLTMVCGYSRWLSAVLIPTRSAADVFAGSWQLIAALGAVPRVLVWDGEGAVGRWRGGKVDLTAECQGFRGTLATKVIVCKPADPEAKGLIERAHDYLERSFLPGRAFAGPQDFNTQLQHWLALVNTRRRRVLGCAPTDRITADRAAMLALPPVGPVTGWRGALRLPRDHYIRLDSNDYSVHPTVIGRRIEVVADLARVRVVCEGDTVADHERIWAWHQTISDPAHVAAAKALRRERVGVLRPVGEPDVQIRCLNDYDTALGLDTAGLDTGGGVARWPPPEQQPPPRPPPRRGTSAPKWRS